MRLSGRPLVFSKPGLLWFRSEVLKRLLAMLLTFCQGLFISVGEVPSFGNWKAIVYVMPSLTDLIEIDKIQNSALGYIYL